ncbi:MAG: FAD-dependent oxidoreductase [Eubacteriales bacterium]|nr:FAD-dependent oxidoreductase [Eubacteriales bacterium]
MKYMYQPLQIGPMTVNNRYMVPPMSNNYAIATGELSDRSLAYYRERAKGGFGLITIEATVIDPTAKGGPKKHCLFDDSQIDALKRTVDACHTYGAKVMVQLQQAGPEGSAKAAGHPLKSASRVQASCNKDIPLEMTNEQIYELVELYGDAAFRAKKAGVDAVEIHMAHGYLVSSFISPQTNKRLDEFGGCFANRMRLPKLIIDNIRSKVGHNMAVLARINSCDETLGGVTVEDAQAIAAYLEEAGIDAIDVSRSIHLKDEYMWAPSCIHQGFNLDHVKKIKDVVDIPVVTVGRYNDPFLPELVVKKGYADMIAMGRQSIADPHFPNKAAGNHFEEIIPCIGCLQGCVGNMFVGQPIECLVNPFVGYEAHLTDRTETPKNVMVVGAGVGGLFTAYQLAKKGHKVDLYEKEAVLGGQMRLAAVPPGKGDITTAVRSYIVLCEKNNVNIHTGVEVTEEMIKEMNPDVLVIATGAKPLRPGITGIDNTVDAIDVLDGKKQCGKKVLVIGAGLVGCETADYLAERGFDVSVVEAKDQIAGDIIGEHRIYLLKSFEENHVKTYVNEPVEEIFVDGVKTAKMDLRGFDSVVLALGSSSYQPFAEGIVKEQYVIGDAVRARRAIDALREAREIIVQI